ncbi:MAG: hypothetical protein ABIQ31_17925 [Ferruginibacter sp.]
MTGTGLWKDWNTQEFLEELIRVTFPKAKVNDIVPFTRYIGEFTIPREVVFDPHIVYFAKITAPLKEVGSVPPQVYLGGSDLVKVSGLTDFILYSGFINVGSSNGNNTIETGWKITLDNEIKNIQEVEQPPVIDILNGRVFNPVWFYAADANNSTGARILYVQSQVEGDVDSVQLTVPGFSEYAPAALGIADNQLDALDVTLPFQAKLRGTVSPDHILTSNEITKDFTGSLKHFNKGAGGWLPDSNQWKQPFNNCIIGDILLLQYYDVDGTLIDEKEITVAHASFQVVFDGVAIDPAIEPVNTCMVAVQPTVGGVQCPFVFFEYLRT